MTIRRETPADYEAVYALIQEAFASAEHRNGTEQDLAAALRKGGAFVPELSLVAEEASRPVGHVLFSKGRVGGETVLVLAPLSVLPEFQRRGVGTALVLEGHRIAAELGYGYSVVLGSETYYPRMGYVPAAQLGIRAPEGIPSANLMAVRLREDAPPLDGLIIYAPEFGI